MKKMLLAKKEVLCNKLLHHPVKGAPFFIPRLFLLLVCFSLSVTSMAQPGSEADKEAAYKKVLTERSAKIVNTLGLTDSAKYKTVLADLVNQYFQVNTIHENNKLAVATIKAGTQTEQEKTTAISSLEEKKSAALLQLHAQFISLLQKQLSKEQVEAVKNGMTYNVLNVTYTAYQDMIPTLTAAQKTKIYDWLLEAREKAMDEGSSDDKHKMFGKYKGRINNYLSGEGYNMKDEEKAWQQRLREKREKEAAAKQQQSSK